MQLETSHAWRAPAILFGTCGKVRSRVTKLTAKALRLNSWDAALEGSDILNLQDPGKTIAFYSSQHVLTFDRHVSLCAVGKGIAEGCGDRMEQVPLLRQAILQGLDHLWIVTGFLSDPGEASVVWNLVGPTWNREVLLPLIHASIRWSEEIEWLERKAASGGINYEYLRWTHSLLGWTSLPGIDCPHFYDWKPLNNAQRVAAVSAWLQEKNL